MKIDCYQAITALVVPSVREKQLFPSSLQKEHMKNHPGQTAALNVLLFDMTATMFTRDIHK
jgi:hypothetical protein